MRLLIDMVMAYRGYHGCPSKCGVRIYEPTSDGETYVAIYTELEDNNGTSVTNAAETVATGIWEFLERPNTPITFIEHYKDRAFIGGRPQFKEHFDRVTFEPKNGGFAKPKWRRILKEEVERLTRATSL
jgi:hypothetical protein